MKGVVKPPLGRPGRADLGDPADQRIEHRLGLQPRDHLAEALVDPEPEPDMEPPSSDRLSFDELKTLIRLSPTTQAAAIQTAQQTAAEHGLPEPGSLSQILEADDVVYLAVLALADGGQPSEGE